MSVPFSARDAANWTRGSLLRGSPETSFAGVAIDSRAIDARQLFVAIVGPNHDAHRFLSQVAAAGAAGLLIERERELPPDLAPDLAVIAVDDTTRGLGALAKGHRAAFDGPVVAITGSNGKTTTKEMCAAILSLAAPCLKNAGNLNNHFGLPLSLLRRSTADRSVVVELGMNRRGEIAELTDIARPSVGIVTNVGTAHIAQLGSRDEIALGPPPGSCASVRAATPTSAPRSRRPSAAPANAAGSSTWWLRRGGSPSRSPVWARPHGRTPSRPRPGRWPRAPPSTTSPRGSRAIGRWRDGSRTWRWRAAPC
jgi:hypothetical protein